MIIQNKKTTRGIMLKISILSGDSDSYLGHHFFYLERYSVFANEIDMDGQK
jgi:hypothetical protein